MGNGDGSCLSPPCSKRRPCHLAGWCQSRGLRPSPLPRRCPNLPSNDSGRNDESAKSGTRPLNVVRLLLSLLPTKNLYLKAPCRPLTGRFFWETAWEEVSRRGGGGADVGPFGSARCWGMLVRPRKKTYLCEAAGRGPSTSPLTVTRSSSPACSTSWH